MGVFVAAPGVLYGAALWRPIPYVDEAPPMREYRGWILHVVVGDGSPYNYFCGLPKGKRAFSHLWVAKNGRIEQYQRLNRQSWAQASGNPYWWSVETEGKPDEPLTKAQIRSLAAWHVWCGAKDAVTNKTTGRGIGTHSMGGARWGGHECPGRIRAGQRADIIAEVKRIRSGRTQEIDLEDGMELDDVVYTEGNGVPVTVRTALRGAYKDHLGIGDLMAKIDEIHEAVVGSAG